MMTSSQDTAWKMNDWASVKDCLSKFNSETVSHKIVQSYLGVVDGKGNEVVEALLNQGTQLALKSFQCLPDVPSPAHLPLLQSFHKIVELRWNFDEISDFSLYLDVFR